MQTGAVIITGASAGIGAETARSFASERPGSKLVITARREDRLRALAAELETSGTHVTVVAGDICDAAVREKCVDAALALGGLWAVVNNAGVGQVGPVELVTAEAARRQLEINVIAPMELLRVALPHMRKQRAGRIVNVSSVLGVMSIPGMGWYSTSKHALEALTETMRIELAPFGIHVATVRPGHIDTEFSAASVDTSTGVGADPSGDYGWYARVLEGRAARATNGAGGKADWVAHAIVDACTSEFPRAVYRITMSAHTVPVLRSVLPTVLGDSLIRRTFGVPARA